MDDGVFRRLVRRIRLTIVNRDHEILIAYGLADLGFKPQGLRRDLVQRLEHRGRVAGPRERGGRRRIIVGRLIRVDIVFG